MSYRDWHVGMEVVCVDAVVRSPYSRALRKGAIYKISAIKAGAFRDGYLSESWVDGVGIKLAGFDMPKAVWFNVSRFRPVQKRNTDISIFKRLLTDPNVKISEDA